MLKRITQTALAIALASAAFSAQAVEVTIYDAQFNPAVPLIGRGGVVMKNGKRNGRGLVVLPEQARSANDVIQKTLAFYQNHLGRLSYDGQGAPIHAIVNMGSFRNLDVFGFRQNAAWMGSGYNLFLFGRGGGELKEFTKSLDVVAHEFTHAVIESSSNLEYAGESGALNESFADIFGESAQLLTEGSKGNLDFLIGETVVTDALKAYFRDQKGREIVALRDMMSPEKGLERQPGHVNQIPAEFRICSPTAENDKCGVHVLSGIPNKAAALIMKNIGTKRALNLFYDVMTRRMTKTSNFNDFGREMRRSCSTMLSASECLVVDNSLREVGL